MKYRIKELREKRGMSQEELSKKASVAREIISRLETGRSDTTTTKTLEKIADALDVKVTSIFSA